MRQCVAAGQPGTLSARPAALRACRARTPHSRQPYAVIVLALASTPSPPSGHTPGGPVWLESRGAGSAIARAASSESSSMLPALDSGVCPALLDLGSTLLSYSSLAHQHANYVGGYNGAGSGGNEGGSNGWGGGGGDDGQGESAEELFKAAGRTLESLPPGGYFLHNCSIGARCYRGCRAPVTLPDVYKQPCYTPSSKGSLGCLALRQTWPRPWPRASSRWRSWRVTCAYQTARSVLL